MDTNLSSKGDPQLLSDLFHALSQPLTTLRCGLGLSLQKLPDDNQNRQSLEIASQAAESVARLVAGIRELMESANSNPAAERSNVTECLQGMVDDLRPVAQSMRLSLCLTPAVSIHVAIEPARLRQALFHLLGFALESSAAGSELQIAVFEEDLKAVLTMQGLAPDRPFPQDQALQMRLALAIADRTFETAGGGLHLESTPGRFSLTIHLPCVLGRSLRERAASPAVCA